MLSSSRLTALALFAAGAVAAQPAPPPIPPRTVTAALPPGTLGDTLAAVSARTGLKVEACGADPKAACPGLKFNGTPFWTAMEEVAGATDARISAAAGGGICLAPRDESREASSVSGPFRVVARQVNARFDLAAGRAAYDLELFAHWEPRFPVFFASSTPTITNAADDTGRKLTAGSASVRGFVTGFGHTMPVRLHGLTRASKSVAVLAGSFEVVAAEAMLPFTFRDLSAKDAKGELPADAPKHPRGPATATLRHCKGEAGEWEAEIALAYPKGGPELESFQLDNWLSRNTARLVSPAGKVFAPDGYDFNAEGRPITFTYRFKVNPVGKGWSLVFEASAPLVEFRVPFELKDIPLP